MCQDQILYDNIKRKANIWNKYGVSKATSQQRDLTQRNLGLSVSRFAGPKLGIDITRWNTGPVRVGAQSGLGPGPGWGPYGPIGSLWAHKGPYGPIRALMGPILFKNMNFDEKS